MNREYHKWWSPRLGRDMELLVFGHGGVPMVVFPTSQGRFYEFEDRGMVGAIAHKIDNGEIQLYCLDSVDAESWYNRAVPPRWRIARHVQYDSYVMEEVLPLIRSRTGIRTLPAWVASFGGYHAVNIALRHPDRFHRIPVDERRFRHEQLSRAAITTTMSTSTRRRTTSAT